MNYLKHAEHVSKGGGYTRITTHVRNEQGTVHLTICATCGYIHAECEHECKTGNQCDLCWADAT